MKQCTTCGEKLTDEATYCVCCGKECDIKSQEKIYTTIPQAQPPQSQFQLQYQSQSPPQTQVENKTSKPDNKTEKKSSVMNKVAVPVLIVALLAASTFFALDYFKGGNNTEVPTQPGTIASAEAVTETLTTIAETETTTQQAITTQIMSTTQTMTVSALAGNYKVVTDTSYHNLNLRSGPGTNYSDIGNISSGTILFISQINNGWGLTEYKSKVGWVSMDHMVRV